MSAQLPKDVIQLLAQHPIGRKHGSVSSWSDDVLYTVLAHQLRMPYYYITINDIDKDLFIRHQEFFIKNSQLPVKRLPDVLVVTECEPWDERKLQDLIQEFELGVKRILITQRNFDLLLGTLSKYRPSEKRVDVRHEEGISFVNRSWEGLELNQIFPEIVRRADLLGASDIHLEPAEDHMRIRFRIHGDLMVQRKLTYREGEEVMKSIKLEAKILRNTAGTFQSSRIRIVLPHSKTLDLRVEITPTVTDEAVVMRLLDHKNIDRSIESLNMPDKDYHLLLDSISKTSGLVIITGPTGSGKTTTLYTILQYLNQKEVKVITVEDPVEYRIQGFTQIPIDPERGITFPASIRSAMRLDPDLILIGEIRDEETAKLTISAAETGHLVFSTLHTNNAIEALNRLERLKVDRFQLQTLLRLVIAQRLIGVLCPHCKVARDIKALEHKMLEKQGIAYDPNTLVYDKRGCIKCKGIGTIGRTAVYSSFDPSPKVRELMGTNCGILDIINQAKAQGFKTIMENALGVWLEGKTTFAEVHCLEE